MRALLATLRLAPRTPPRAAANLITRDEFLRSALAAAARRFDAIDVARAGVISRAQVRSWLQANQNDLHTNVKNP